MPGTVTDYTELLKRFVCLILIAMFMMISTVSYAGPPFLTDDPETVEFHHWEVYLASQYANNRDGFSGTLPHFEVNYGAAPDLQLHIIAPFAYDHPNGMPMLYGFGDIELGMKYRFIHETKRRPQIGIFPLIEVPSGDTARGLGSGETQIFLPVWIQKSWGPWTTYGGGGFWHNPGAGNRDYWFTGWLIQRKLSDKLTIGTEIFHASSSAVGESDRTGFNIGMIYDFDEGHHLLFSAGDDIHGQNRSSVYLAYQITFGPHEQEK